MIVTSSSSWTASSLHFFVFDVADMLIGYWLYRTKTTHMRNCKWTRNMRTYYTQYTSNYCN